MRVLVCGGRDFGIRRIVFGTPQDLEWDRERAAIEKAVLVAGLDKLHATVGIDVVIQGGARGADELAFAWARVNGVPDEQFDADWENQGTFAGPMRNKRMIEEGKPDLVLAFPGGKGTANMVKQARKSGIEVVEVGP